MSIRSGLLTQASTWQEEKYTGVLIVVYTGRTVSFFTLLLICMHVCLH